MSVVAVVQHLAYPTRADVQREIRTKSLWLLVSATLRLRNA